MTNYAVSNYARTMLTVVRYYFYYYYYNFIDTTNCEKQQQNQRPICTVRLQ